MLNNTSNFNSFPIKNSKESTKSNVTPNAASIINATPIINTTPTINITPIKKFETAPNRQELRQFVAETTKLGNEYLKDMREKYNTKY